MQPAEDQQFLPTHSPLSPLTPTSPLYPDGLIAPIWIRKHTTLVPSVFVLFKRIFEYPRPQTGASLSPLDVPDPDLDREREAEERRHDTELAQEIVQRKKTTNERAIKLTVVLMASRRMLGKYLHSMRRKGM
jgi:trafficking protein particle complex subunit 11